MSLIICKTCHMLKMLRGGGGGGGGGGGWGWGGGGSALIFVRTQF